MTFFSKGTKEALWHLNKRDIQKFKQKKLKLIDYKKEICLRCKNEVSYSEKYDCYYCVKCNKWLEPKCKDLTCEFCSKRPFTPKNVLYDDLKEAQKDPKFIKVVNEFIKETTKVHKLK